MYLHEPLLSPGRTEPPPPARPAARRRAPGRGVGRRHGPQPAGGFQASEGPARSRTRGIPRRGPAAALSAGAREAGRDRRLDRPLSAPLGRAPGRPGKPSGARTMNEERLGSVSRHGDTFELVFERRIAKPIEKGWAASTGPERR